MRWTWIRKLFVGVVLLFGVAAVGVWLLIQSIDRGAVMARAVQEVKTATGRDFAVDGKVRFRVFPNIALVAEGVRLGNASWGSRPDMARIRQLELHVALRPLLSRRVEIGRVEVDGVDLLLETNATTGQGNWNFARTDADPGASAEAKAPSTVQVTMSELIARNSVLAFRSGRSDHTETLHVEALSLTNEDVATPTDFNQVELDAVFHEQKVHLEGRVGTVRSALAANRSVPLDLALTMDGTTATIKGDVDLGRSAGQARMRVDASVQKAAALSRVVGVALPVPLPATVRADLNWRARELVVDPIELETNGQSVSGRVVWDRTASPPAFDVRIRADSVDLARLYREPNAAPVATVGGRVFSETPFPAIRLPNMTIKTELHVERLVLPNGLELTSLQSNATTHPDRIDVAQLAFGLARGTFNMSGSLNTGTGHEAPRVNASIKARNVAMDALVALLRRQAVIAGGRTQMDATLSATGSSLHAIADSLNGDVRLKMGAAQSVPRRSTNGAETLISALLRALTPLHRPDEPVKITCAAARLPVRNSTIVVDRSIAAESERLDIVMSGEIDLGAERVELAMRPTVKKGTGLDPSSFAGIVKVAGSLSQPAVEVNVEGTAREAVSIGAAVATGGATLLGQRLLGKVTDAHPCESAYNGSASTSVESASQAKKKKGFLAPIKSLFGG